MPTYQYECAKCGEVLEIFQSMKDNALEVCPKDKCAQARWGRGRIRRQVGAGAGLIFKGSGFYITDYRSEGYKSAAKKESESAKPAAETKKADASPASTPAPKPAPKTPAASA